MVDVTFWPGLSQELRSQFESVLESRTYQRGDKVFGVGADPQGLYFVRNGLVGLMLLGASGKEHLLRFFRPGQFFGLTALLSGNNHHGTGLVLQTTQIDFVPKKPLFNILNQNPILYKELGQMMARYLRRIEDQHVMILENQILERTAQALVYLKDLHPDHNWTRQEIANFCASTTPTIIRAMAELEARGLINQEGREIKILDREALIELGK
jgi:CRP-like cAMP-binding protein